jgi:hypothetical protein
MPKLYEFLRASGISWADLSPFIDKDWRVLPNHARELLSLIEARELQFMEGVLRRHMLESEISAHKFFRVLKERRDEFINDLRQSIQYDEPLLLGLQVFDLDDVFSDIREAADMLDEEVA